MAQLVEHILGKDEVPGPNPGSSSRQPRSVCFGALVFHRGKLYICVNITKLQPGTAPGMDTPSLWDELSPEESTGLFTVRIRVAAPSFSLRLGHTRGKTILNRFLTRSCRFATRSKRFGALVFYRGKLYICVNITKLLPSLP